MATLHHLKLHYRETGLGVEEIAAQTTITEAARKNFDKAYADYLALYRASD